MLMELPITMLACARIGAIHSITPLPGAWPQKPGSATFPFFGVQVKGQGIYAFVTLADGVPYSEELRKSLVVTVRKQIGAFAAPDKIHWAPGLPKTRSGKIMRRILRKIASRQLDELGDTSTLADPSVVDQLIALSDS
ncbi:hypothetical protein CRG98_027112 [Punica granatum]|uniref:AMP-binding enzyme C-terminal domain-containing protein n=1 Tax=Punica granatum TaxID=22663 RepID=A0A2I0J9H1_PUNGR|nr:hypothetical protein CRG98_027112 [Punica granatum]